MEDPGSGSENPGSRIQDRGGSVGDRRNPVMLTLLYFTYYTYFTILYLPTRLETVFDPKQNP